MKNVIRITSTGEALLSSTDDGTNRLIINDSEIDPADWVGTGSYTATVEGHSITVAKVSSNTGNIGIRKTETDYEYELYKHSKGGAITINDIYPVGAVCLLAYTLDPNTLYGGTWEVIQDMGFMNMWGRTA